MSALLLRLRSIAAARSFVRRLPTQALKFYSGSADSPEMDCHPRPCATSLFVAAALLMITTPAAAQGFGIGARLAWITNDSALDVDSERFVGGQIRLSGARIGVEVS